MDTVTGEGGVAEELESARPDRFRAAILGSGLIRWFGFSALLFLLLAARRPHALSAPDFFGDDADWFRDQCMYGVRALFMAHGGYWQLAARAIALIASFLPVSLAPLCFTTSAFAIGALCCALFSWSHFRSVVKSDALRVGVCLAAACGVFSDELVGNPTNVQWYILPAGLLLCLVPPRPTRGYYLLWLLLGLAAAASNPLVALAFPFVLVLYLVQRTSPGPFTLGAFLGIGAQLLLFRQPGAHEASFEPGRIGQYIKGAFQLWPSRVFAAVGLGREATLRLFHRPHPLGASIAAVIIIALLIWLARACDRERRTVVVICGLLTFVGFLAPLGLRGKWPELATLTVAPLERNFYLPQVAVAVLVAVAIERFGGRLTERGRAALFGSLLSLGFVHNFRVEPYVPTDWPRHAAQVQEWLEAWRAGRGLPPTVVIPISPPPWTVMLPGLMANPGFEEAELPWRVEPGLVAGRASAAVHSGSHSLSIRGESGVLFQDVAADVGKTYRVRGWARASCGSTGGLFVHDGKGRNVATAELLPERCGQWQEVEAQFKATTSRYARVHLFCRGCSQGTYWDDVTFAQVGR